MKMRFIMLSIALCMCLSSCSLLNNIAPASSAESNVRDEIFTEETNILSRFQNSEGERADLLFMQIIKALEDNNAAELRDWFSSSTSSSVENFDDSIEDLLNFYDGKFISYRRYGPATSASIEGNAKRKEIDVSYDVTTAKTVYRIAFRFCTVDTQNPDNIGVHSFCIIEAAHSDMDFAYWGPGEWNPGIIIEQTPSSNSAETTVDPVVSQLDSDYASALEAASSNVELCEVNQRFTDEWMKMIEEYYSHLQKISPESLQAQFDIEKTQWFQYAEIRVALEQEYLQQVYGAGTILPVILSKFQCDLYRERAIELIEMYSQLQKNMPIN